MALNLFNRKKDNEIYDTVEEKKENEQETVIEEVNPEKFAKSINKRRVMAAVACVVVLTGAVMAYNSTQKPLKKEQYQSSDIPDSADKEGKNYGKNIDYSSLQRFNNKGKNLPGNKSLNQNGEVPTTYSESQALQEQSNYQTSQVQTLQGQVEKEDDKYIASAISFKLGNMSTSEETTGGVDSSTPFDQESAAQKALLTAGTTIPVTLLTGITSNLSGEVIAQVRQDVYDSLTGTKLLIPSGSKLIGSYSGQNMGRVDITFKSIILPNTQTIDLGSAKAIDGTGYAGIYDRYTEHTSRVVGGAAITAAISALLGGQGSNVKKEDRTAGQEAKDQALASIMESFQKIIGKKTDIPPTAEISPGFNFNVMIVTDLALAEYW
ncbi:TrbI/VirB10 family protein [Dialister micraerophilus]|uniref:TrbI/VirB10 family protein n=1 Tax=Dialister micraerophilus TaxID=309120 RepID=UPI0023F1FEAA|nr:TrbI/VirB10 family protein [Dialister micraerophilus]